MLLMTTFGMQRERDRLKSTIETKDSIPVIVLRCDNGSSNFMKRSSTSLVNGVHTSKKHNGKKTRRRHGSMEELERRRGGSPIPESDTTIQGKSPRKPSSKADAALSSVRSLSSTSPSEQITRVPGDDQAPLSLPKLPPPPSSDKLPSSHPYDSRRSSDDLSHSQSNTSPSAIKQSNHSSIKPSSSKNTDFKHDFNSDSDDLTPLQRPPRRLPERSASDELTPLQRPTIHDKHEKHDDLRDGHLESASNRTSGQGENDDPNPPTGLGGPADALHRGIEMAKETAKEVLLRSEGREGWWMYFSIIGSIVIAVILGLF